MWKIYTHARLRIPFFHAHSRLPPDARMDWKALLADFVAKLNDATKDKSAEEKATIVAAATDALPQEARQHLHSLGHADGLKDADKDKGTSAAELAQAKKDLEAKEAEVTKLNEQLAEKQPEVAKIKADYEAALTAKDAEVKAAQEKAAADLKDEREASASRQLQTALTGVMLTEALARGQAADPVLRSRLKVDDDGALRAYQADGKTPLAVTSGQTAVEALVADLAGTLDKSLLRANGAGGSGAQGGDATHADDFEAIRNEVKDKYGGDTKDKKEMLSRLR